MFQTVMQKREMTEGLSHMEEALRQFAAADEAGADSSSITDNFLEPLNLTFTEPDFSRLEKPAKPPVPEVITHWNLSPSSIWIILDYVCYSSHKTEPYLSVFQRNPFY